MLRTAAPDEVFALVKRRELFATRDGGASWSQVGRRGLPDSDVLQLVVDATSPTRVFVATMEGFFRSTDRGVTFTKIGSALENEHVHAVVTSSDGSCSPARSGGISLAGRRLDLETRLWIGLGGGSVWSAPLPRK